MNTTSNATWQCSIPSHGLMKDLNKPLHPDALTTVTISFACDATQWIVTSTREIYTTFNHIHPVIHSVDGVFVSKQSVLACEYINYDLQTVNSKGLIVLGGVSLREYCIQLTIKSKKKKKNFLFFYIEIINVTVLAYKYV